MPTPWARNCAVITPATARVRSAPATRESRLSRDGFEKLFTRPVKRAVAISSSRESAPCEIDSAIASGASPAATCRLASSQRASTRSASAPPNGSRKIEGSIVAICTRPVRVALDCSTFTTSQGTSTCCMPQAPNHAAAPASSQGYRGSKRASDDMSRAR